MRVIVERTQQQQQQQHLQASGLNTRQVETIEIEPPSSPSAGYSLRQGEPHLQLTRTCVIQHIMPMITDRAESSIVFLFEEGSYRFDLTIKIDRQKVPIYVLRNETLSITPISDIDRCANFDSRAPTTTTTTTTITTTTTTTTACFMNNVKRQVPTMNCSRFDILNLSRNVLYVRRLIDHTNPRSIPEVNGTPALVSMVQMVL
ncbi:hypothetical protein M0804_003626 [Polistes exclamans]|nr:hypothetical protein M0804_003626 [Polistes exclamans]